MTAHDFARCDDAAAMVEAILGGRAQGTPWSPTPRKWRLCAAAMARVVLLDPPSLAPEHTRHKFHPERVSRNSAAQVRQAEAFADSLISPGMLADARSLTPCLEVTQKACESEPAWACQTLSCLKAYSEVFADIVRDVIGGISQGLNAYSRGYWWEQERKRPYFTAEVNRLAEAAYRERLVVRTPHWGDEVPGEIDPGVCAALSDALEEAGFQDQAVLAHLRREPRPCHGCAGTGSVLVNVETRLLREPLYDNRPCLRCNGVGVLAAPPCLLGCATIDSLTGRW